VAAAVSALVAIALALVAGAVLRNVRRDPWADESTLERDECDPVAGDQKLQGALS
jgi:hypothetical protein